MKNEMNEDELREIAKQLSHPEGEFGVKTGERMNQSNENMINRGLEALGIKAQDRVLEIGPGNGLHVGSILNLADHVTYQGLDISETMRSEAAKINAGYVSEGRASFTLGDGIKIDSPDNTFDKIFTVNTVYFWQDPVGYAREIHRVLKPGGIFSLVFADKRFMQDLPFTRFGFTLYDKESAGKILTQAGFTISATFQEREIVRSVLGEDLERPFIIMLAAK